MTDRYCSYVKNVMNPTGARETLRSGESFYTTHDSWENVGKCLLIWNVEKQEANGLFRVSEDPVPDGKVVQSWVRIIRDGRPVDVPTYTDYVVPGAEVNEEMYRRLELDLSYLGHSFQMNETSRNLIRRAAVQASVFLLSGGQADDAKWHLPADQKASGAAFAWIASDNTPVPMLASETVAFGTAVDTREMFLRMKARGLKDMTPIPLDYADEKYWI